MAIQRIDAISVHRDKDVSVVQSFISATICCWGGI